MEYGVIVVANADLQRRMEARAIHRLDRVPEPLHVVPRQAGDVRVGLRAPRGHRREIIGDAAEPAERPERLSHSRQFVTSASARKRPLAAAVAGERPPLRLLSITGAQWRQ